MRPAFERATCTVWNVHSYRSDAMFDYRRIALWLAVLLVPGGLLLLPVLIADMRRGKSGKSKGAPAASQPAPSVAV